MHLARDAATLVFLCKDQAREQLGTGPFGTFPFADLRSQGGVRAGEFRGALAHTRFELLMRAAKRFLRLLPFGEVEMCAHDPHDRSCRFAADRQAAREHMDVVAVLVPQAKLPLVDGLPALDALVRLVGA